MNEKMGEPSVKEFKINDHVDEKALALLQAWSVHPLPSVGDSSASLLSIPANSDWASLTGCRSQHYTTWNCIERNYICGMVESLVDQVENVTVRMYNTKDDADVRIIQDESELAKLEIPDQYKRLFGKGKYAFFTDGTYCKIGSKMYNDKITDLKVQQQYETEDEPAKIDEVIGLRTVHDIHETPLVDDDEEGWHDTLDRLYDGRDDVGLGGKFDDKTLWWVPDILPVRSVMATTWMTEFEQDTKMPVTPLFSTLTERLTDTSTGGALMSVVRGPNTRDATSIIALAKHLIFTKSNWKDSAPLVRLMCLNSSFDDGSWQMDPTPYHMILRWLPNDPGYGRQHRILTYAEMMWKPPVSNIIVVPLDIAVSIGTNKPPFNMIENFGWDTMDESWTMVPIRQTMLGSHWMIPYIAAFMDSWLWAGRVNNYVHGTALIGDWQHKRKLNYTAMPMCNSVRIPGPKNVMLVLMDCTTAYHPNTVRIWHNDVEVFNGENAGEATTNFTNIWNEYFVTANAGRIPYDCGGAFNEICGYLAVDDACGRAVALASELYGGNRLGIKLTIKDKQKGYDFNTTYGAWAYEGGAVDKLNGKIMATAWTTDLNGKWEEERQRIIGFNLGTITPYHRQNTAVIKSTALPDRTNSLVYCGWGSGDGVIGTPAYRTTACSSLMRMCIAAGLVSTGGMTYKMDTGRGMAAFTNMVSQALAFSTMKFLLNSDLGLRAWLGWETSDTTRMVHYYGELMRRSSAGISIFVDLANLDGQIVEWDWNMIEKYYGTVPETNHNWASHSPWPIHCIKQWCDKLSFETEKKNWPLENVLAVLNNNRIHVMGLKLDHSMKEWKAYIPATIDLLRYYSYIYAEVEGEPDSLLDGWFAPWSYFSSMQRSNLASSEHWTSATLIYNTENTPWSTCRGNLFLVANTIMAMMGDQTILRANNLVFPDPPSVESFLQKVRDYVLIPAVQGGLGYIVGGPVGAAAHAAFAVTRQVQSDLQKNAIAKEAVEQAKTALVEKEQEQKNQQHPETMNIQEQGREGTTIQDGTTSIGGA